MRIRRVVTAVVAGLLALATPAALAHTMGTSTVRAAVPPGINTAQHPVAHGMVLNNITTPIAAVAVDIPRLALDGINTLTIYVYEFVDDPTSTSVHPTLLGTPSDTELKAVIALAHASGMDVTLSPMPWKENPYVWRGTFHPADVGAFFDSWRTVVNHYADLAQATGVTMLAIGSEQNSLVQYKDQWEQTAMQARAHFSGLLTYLATVDTVFSVPFWDAVDVASISPYLVISQAAVPTYGEMRAAWLTNNIPFLQRVHDTSHKPVFLAETGYVSAQYLGAIPFKEHPSNVPAPQAQADAYRATLDALDIANPSWLYGIQWFSWDIPRGSILDTSFTPRDKPAECVLAQHWGSGLVQTVANLLPCGSGTSG